MNGSSRVRVRISSEAAGAISMTPVVVQDILVPELVDHMVAVCGKDAVRIAELMRRGSMVDGGSRFRWQGWEPAPAEIESLLAGFPDPDPRRPFVRDGCLLAVLCGGNHRIHLPREAAQKRRLLRRRSFWDYVVTLGPAAAYVDYSYREKADVYRAHLTVPQQQTLLEASELLTYSSLTQQIGQAAIDTVDLYVSR